MPEKYVSQYGQAERDAINESLRINFANKLFRESFLIFERAILHMKFNLLQKSSTVIHVICSQCTKFQATLYCFQCLDHMCWNCSEYIHVGGCKGH